MENSGKTLGILGGLGPMSSVYFYQMLTQHTKACRDQQHLNILLSSRSDTPDRTDFILGRSNENPLCVMRSEAQKLVGAGADIIAIPCNTAHYFYEGITNAVDVPVINIIRQTAIYCKRSGLGRVGLLATEGTVSSGAYTDIFSVADVECVVPSEEEQGVISEIIYGQIKSGREPDMTAFMSVAQSLVDKGCEKIILGCTELSLLKKSCAADLNVFIDSLEILAYSAIRMCGKEPVGFDSSIMSFRV